MFRFSRVLALAMILLLSANGRGESPHLINESWRLRVYRDMEGEGIRCMTELPDGSMCFGGDRGVLRYDGYKIEPMGAFPSESSVRTVCVTANGDILAGNRFGIWELDARTKEWSRLYPRAETACSVYKVIESKDGAIWAATVWGPLQLDRVNGTARLYTSTAFAHNSLLLPRTKVITLADRYWPIIKYPDGAGALNNGPYIYGLAPNSAARAAGLQVGDRLIRINGVKLPPYSLLRASPGTRLRVEAQRGDKLLKVELTCREYKDNFPSPYAATVFEDRAGVIWVGTQHGKVLRYTGNAPTEEDSWNSFSAENAPQLSSAPRFLERSNGEIWVVSKTPGGGLSRFDGKEWRSEKLRRLGGSDNLTSIVETPDGSVWVGGTGFLHEYRDQKWNVYDLAERGIPDAQPQLFVKSNGSLWIAGERQAVAAIDLSDKQWLTLRQGLKFFCEEADGTQWFVEDNAKVLRFQDGEWTSFDANVGLMKYPKQVFVDANRHVWATGAHEGAACIARLHGKRWLKQTFPEFSESILTDCLLTAADGSSWLSAVDRTPRSLTGGLLRIRNGIGEVIVAPELPRRSVAIGQLRDQIYSVAHSGIRVLEEGSWKPVELPVGAHVNGSCLYQADEELWIGTMDYGVIRLGPKGVQNFTISDGIPSNHIRGIVSPRPGYVLVSTNSGFAAYDGKTWRQTDFPTELAGAKLSLDRRGGIWFDRRKRYAATKEAPISTLQSAADVIQAGQDFQLVWSSRDFWNNTPSSELHYTLRIDGGEWTSFQNRRRHRLHNLASGEHVVEVLARDRDFNLESTPLRHEFYVQPPFWQRGWVQVCCGLLAVTLLVQTGRVINRGSRLVVANQRLSESKNELEQRVAERTKALTVSNEQLRAEIAEKQRIEAEREDLIHQLEAKNAELDRYAYTVSHDLKSPLVTIRGFAGMLRNDLKNRDAARVEDAVNEIFNGVDHMQQILEQLLRMARIGRVADPTATVNMRDVFEQAVMTVEAAFALRRPEIVLPEQLPSVRGDRIRLFEITQNLLENAVKFTPEDTRPHIRVQASFDQDTQLTVFAVTDNGIGIAPQYQRRIFELFNQLDSHTAGSGAGLAIVKRVVEVHGGRIWVESEGVGRGTTFFFSLPIVGETSAPDEQVERPVSTPNRPAGVPSGSPLQ